MKKENRIINKISRVLLLPKELIGFINGLIASYLSSILIDSEFSDSTKIYITLGGLSIIVMSIVLIKYRDNYDDNRNVKSKSEAWQSINNNESANKIFRLLPQYGIPIIYLITAGIIIGSIYPLVSENNHIKQEQENTIEIISQTDSLVRSIDLILRPQVNHVDSIKINMQRIEHKIDSLFILNDQLIRNKNRTQKVKHINK